MDPGSREECKVYSAGVARAFLRATLSTTKIIDIRRARVRAVIRGATSSGGKEWLTVHLSAELRQIIVLILPPFSLYMSGIYIYAVRITGAGWRARVSGYRL